MIATAVPVGRQEGCQAQPGPGGGPGRATSPGRKPKTTPVTTSRASALPTIFQSAVQIEVWEWFTSCVSFVSIGLLLFILISVPVPYAVRGHIAKHSATCIKRNEAAPGCARAGSARHQRHQGTLRYRSMHSRLRRHSRHVYPFANTYRYSTLTDILS